MRSNATATAIFGRPGVDVIGRRCWEVAHGATGPIPGCPALRSRGTRERESLELQIGEREYDVVCDPVLDAEGVFAGAVHVVTDITERARADRAVRESEAQIRGLFEGVTLGIATARLVVEDGRPVDWVWEAANDAYGAVTGLRDVVGRRASEAMPGVHERDPFLLEFYGRIAETGVPDSYERQVSSVGRTIAVSAFSPGPGRFTAILSDVTERSRSEHAIAESRRLLDETQAIARLGGWEFDVASGRVTWTDEVYAIYGVDRGLDLSDPEGAIAAYAPDSAPVIEAALRRAVEPGEPYDLELELDRADGRRVWVRTTGRPVVVDGVVARVNGYILDITERKVAEVALRASRQELAEAQRMAHVGSWTWVVDGDCVSWSDELFRIFGLEPAATAPSFAEHQRMYTDETRGALLAAVERAVETGEGYEVPLDVVRPDGAIRHVVSRGRADRGPGGSVAGLHGTVMDLTERQESEALIARAEKLEVVGQLAGGVAHDFNNLLGVILGNAEMTRSELGADDPRSAAMTEIEEAAHRGATLTRQLLAFSRQQVISPEALEIDAVVGEMEALLGGAVGESVGLEFVAGAAGVSVRADRAQFGQVLLNLAANARDAMPSGGTLRIATETVDVGAADAARPAFVAPGRYATVTLTDTGTGMDEGVRAHLFEPFYTTKGPGKGSGLGLSTAQGIARQGGGDLLLADTVPGRGSAFVLYLPVTEDARPAAPVVASVSPMATGTATVLVVDDDAGLLRLTARILAKAGFSVLTAADGLAALAALAAHPGPVALVVTDVIMPVMGGHELARRVPETRPETRILLMSGYPGDVVLPDGMLLSGAPFLAKPFTAAEVTAKVREVLSA